MTTPTSRAVQRAVEKVLARVERGEGRGGTSGAKIVAGLVPPQPAAILFPDFVTRARAIWGDSPAGAPLSRILSDARGPW